MKFEQPLRLTVLVRTEGYRDRDFVEYLYNVYHVREISVKVKNEYGGDPKSLIETMVRVDLPKCFDRYVGMFDTDQGAEVVTKAETLAGAHNISVVKSVKSIDSELVSILTDEKKLLTKAKKSTDDAKDALLKLCHLSDVDDKIDWPRYFPKSLLDEKRESSPWLDSLIRLIREN